MDGFTVHGLTKVFKGSRKEACVWMLFICLGMLFAGLVIGRLVAKYYRYETYTEVKSIVTDENLLPSITVCEIQELQMAYFNYCGTRMSDRSGSDKNCNISNIPDSLVRITAALYKGNGRIDCSGSKHVAHGKKHLVTHTPTSNHIRTVRASPGITPDTSTITTDTLISDSNISEMLLKNHVESLSFLTIHV